MRDGPLELAPAAAPAHRSIIRGALAFSAVVLLTRVWFIVHRAFDVDELEHAHAAWSVARGLLPYRDFFEHHGPALYLLFGPLYAPLAPETDIASATRTLLMSRTAMWALTIMSCALTFRIAQRWHASNSLLRGALATGLLAGSWQFLNTALEFRPDVPALVCLLVSFLCVFNADPARPRNRVVWLMAAGFAFGLSALFTQKTVFAAPGLLVGAYARHRVQEFMAFLGGAVLPIAVVAAWFTWQGATVALYENSVAMNVRLTTDRGSPIPQLLSSVSWNFPLYVTGMVGAVMAARQRVSGARRAVLVGLASLGAGIVIMARVYDQYYLMMLPLLAVLGADAIVNLAGGRISFHKLVAAVGGAAIVFLIGAASIGYQSNDAQIDQMRLVMERTHVDDTVLSGVPGAGTFRPHAWYYFFLSSPFARDRDFAALGEALETRRVNPRIVIFDARVSAMPTMVREYLRAHYRPVRGTIYERVD